ncbi:hypothetical protein [Sphingobacterium gobiense]|uniref:Phage abortive infection protein n=1 Tax=Sphingobacterium gobiense TaxID=1382456 RepID=A0A2S9JU06_9SPHI|nr:hypothetical protein [Sphingobacterium gobiense]PRD56743.1 hypothetical protein C5749_05810 [Sphingobacterium gobiense]
MNKFYRCNNFVLILLGIAISAFGIMIPILYTNNEVDGTNVSNSIQFLTLLVGIATIAYVIKTFELQRKQIEDNNRNTEFNRVLDITYRQLDITKDRLKELDELSVSLIEVIRTRDDLFENQPGFRKYLYNLTAQTYFYKRLLNKSYLSYNDKQFVFLVFYDNIPPSILQLTFHIQILIKTATKGGKSMEGLYRTFLAERQFAEILQGKEVGKLKKAIWKNKTNIPTVEDLIEFPRTFKEFKELINLFTLYDVLEKRRNIN